MLPPALRGVWIRGFTRPADPGDDGESRREEGTCTQQEHMTDSKRSLNLIIWARLFRS